MRAVAEALPEGDPARPVLLASAARHAEASLPYVESGDYLGEHWLASFAVYLLTGAGAGGRRQDGDAAKAATRRGLPGESGVIAAPVSIEGARLGHARG